MTILITGATGTVGKHIVQQLVLQGNEVRAISRIRSMRKCPRAFRCMPAISMTRIV